MELSFVMEGMVAVESYKKESLKMVPPLLPPNSVTIEGGGVMKKEEEEAKDCCEATDYHGHHFWFL